jgi:hypothetical protein
MARFFPVLAALLPLAIVTSIGRPRPLLVMR